MTSGDWCTVHYKSQKATTDVENGKTKCIWNKISDAHQLNIPSAS